MCCELGCPELFYTLSLQQVLDESDDLCKAAAPHVVRLIAHVAAKGPDHCTALFDACALAYLVAPLRNESKVSGIGNLIAL